MKGIGRSMQVLRLTSGVVLMLVGFMMALTACLLVFFGISQVVTVIGVGGVILFSLGVIVWHTEP